MPKEVGKVELPFKKQQIDRNQKVRTSSDQHELHLHSSCITLTHNTVS